MREATWAEIKTDKKIMNDYTSTWTEPPKWAIRSKRVARGYQTQLSTQDKKFIWVEHGTKKRFRRMSPDFSAKSTVGSLRARPGSGKALGFYKTPRPGIKARNNLETLAQERTPIFVKKLQLELNANASKLFSK